MPVSKKNQLVGIDIGSHSIKVAEIDDSKRGMMLKNFGIIGLPENAVVEGSIREMEVVSAALKNLLRNLKMHAWSRKSRLFEFRMKSGAKCLELS